MKCLICGKENFVCIHKGTRDFPDINVMRCCECGMVALDSRENNTEENYSQGGMLKDSYGAVANRKEDMQWDTWVEETRQDDERRYIALKELCRDKEVLEFGCGNGGFLKRIKNVASGITGIELMDEAREKISRGGVEIYRSLEEVKRQYDVICMFMVIEHLNNPDVVLKKLRGVLKDKGILICETVNANDALISKYGCDAFMDFTYWSEHVFLFASDTLEKLFERDGFTTVWNTQIQRYPLANHLYWLSQGKPGGHIRWEELGDRQLDDFYAKKMVSMGIADTLWYAGGVKKDCGLIP